MAYNTNTLLYSFDLEFVCDRFAADRHHCYCLSSVSYERRLENKADKRNMACDNREEERIHGFVQ